MNTVQHTGYVNSANKSTGATLSINGKAHTAHSEVIGWKGSNYDKPINQWYVAVRYDWNMTNQVKLTAKTLNQLIAKIKKDQHKIVK